MFFNFKKKPERIIFYTIIIILSIGLVLLLEELVSKVPLRKVSSRATSIMVFSLHRLLVDSM